MPDRATATTPRPATVPAKDTVPGAAARTGCPALVARSTPRWPAAQRTGGGSHARTIKGRPPCAPETGQARSPAAPSARGGPVAAAVTMVAMSGAAAVSGAGAVGRGAQVKRVTTQTMSAVTASKTLRTAVTAAVERRVEDRMGEP